MVEGSCECHRLKQGVYVGVWGGSQGSVDKEEELPLER